MDEMPSPSPRTGELANASAALEVPEVQSASTTESGARLNAATEQANSLRTNPSRVLEINIDIGSSMTRAHVSLARGGAPPNTEQHEENRAADPSSEPDNYAVPTVIAVRKADSQRNLDDPVSILDLYDPNIEIHIGREAAIAAKHSPNNWTVFKHLKRDLVDRWAGAEAHPIVEMERAQAGVSTKQLQDCLVEFLKGILKKCNKEGWNGDSMDIYVNTCSWWKPSVTRRFIEMLLQAANELLPSKVTGIPEGIAAAYGAMTNAERHEKLRGNAIVVDIGHMDMNVVQLVRSLPEQQWALGMSANYQDCGAGHVNLLAAKLYAQIPAQPEQQRSKALHTVHDYVEEYFKLPSISDNPEIDNLTPEHAKKVAGLVTQEAGELYIRQANRVTAFIKGNKIRCGTLVLTGGPTLNPKVRKEFEKLKDAFPGLTILWSDYDDDRQNGTSAVERGLQKLRATPNLGQPIYVPIDLWTTNDLQFSNPDNLQNDANIGRVWLCKADRKGNRLDTAGNLRSLPCWEITLENPTTQTGKSWQLDLSLYTTPQGKHPDNVCYNYTAYAYFSRREQLTLVDHYFTTLTCDSVEPGTNSMHVLLFPAFHHYTVNLIAIYADNGCSLDKWARKSLGDIYDFSQKTMRPGFQTYEDESGRPIRVKVVQVDVQPSDTPHQSGVADVLPASSLPAGSSRNNPHVVDDATPSPNNGEDDDDNITVRQNPPSKRRRTE